MVHCRNSYYTYYTRVLSDCIKISNEYQIVLYFMISHVC